MLSEEDIKECDKAKANFERGGEEFKKWLFALIKSAKWDTVNTDIHLAANDKIYDLWKSGKTVKELVKDQPKKRGAALTTGRFETREELIDCINFMYWDGDRSIAACARNANVSETTAAKLIMGKNAWENRK